MLYGSLPANDSSFRALCFLLASSRPYGNMPLSRVNDLYRTLQLQQNFCAIENDDLKGVVLWGELGRAVALRCIEERKPPQREELSPTADAVVVLGIVGASKAQLRAMWNKFLERHPDRVILYERHAADGTSKFLWYDRKHRLQGRDL